MKLVLAISGGVDSMTLLDWCAKHYSSEELVVAHFDHGTRPSAADDAQFVVRKAKAYGLDWRLGHAKLGVGASEARARQARYTFLRQVAREFAPATIVTAHHLDDLVESVTINLLRGTGWRGLAVMTAPDIWRPFLEKQPWGKAEIWRYANQHQLTYREDPTNSSDEYLRNRLRHQMNNNIDKQSLYSLWTAQTAIKTEIDHLIDDIIPEKVWARNWFEELESTIALELLRAGTLRAGITATRPQLEDLRQAILHYAPQKSFNLPGDVLLKIGKTDFQL